MCKTDEIIVDAKTRLEEIESLSDISCQHVETRYFSDIFILQGLKNKVSKAYVLKISTTARTCENEYLQYLFLQKKHVRTLNPVYHSSRWNYLLTEKEDLREFDAVVRKQTIDLARQSLFHFGAAIAELVNKTGNDDKFDAEAYNHYTLPRVTKLTTLPHSKREILIKNISQISSHQSGRGTKSCFVSDFALGNVHLDSNDQIVFVDMGDAKHGNLYDNLACIYLNMNYVSINKYIITKRTTILFNEFMRGLNLQDVDPVMFDLYKIRHLVNMISFTEGLVSNAQNRIRKQLSLLGNQYNMRRYTRHLEKIIELNLKS